MIPDSSLTAPCHVSAPPYFGVTTSRSIGSDPPDKVPLALDVRAWRIPGPRLYTADLGCVFSPTPRLDHGS